ncbi:nitrile hydratase subunit alpha [Asaia sp. As-1742]|uniref:nitrile hydratase subunit alpha n=1 Tax=Asaia sp. As-1742 TaxID=2608325 RepID=UPI00142227DE|nr:nitrile hydratase subunit alpha [Asaia sp. As-1742]NIE80248.1 nitrile hydratase subunit alpha [Asaia sp. As-1742]
MSKHPDHSHSHDHGPLPDDLELRVESIESLLVDKNLVDPAALDALVDTYQNHIGPRNGAAVVARAWSEPAFLARLLDDATAAISEMGFSGGQGEDMIVVENTDGIHNIIVCTLCSCYPWPVLGLPPAWYKAAPYRARIVREPRAVLAEFGLTVPETKEVRVWDSSAEIRYMVLPQRPAGTEGWTAEQLAPLVTRDSMIGTGIISPPAQAERGDLNGAPL